MIKERDFVYLKCLVVSAMPLAPVKISDEPIEPDVVDLIPVYSNGKIIERFRDKPLSFLVETVIPIEERGE